MAGSAFLLSKYILISFLITPFSALQMWMAVYSAYCLGKSNSTLRKRGRVRAWWKKLSLFDYVEQCKYYQTQSKWIRRLYWLDLSLLVLCSVLVLLHWLIPLLCPMLEVCARIKVFGIDLPFAIYAFIMTKHDKVHGGCQWRWEDRRKNDCLLLCIDPNLQNSLCQFPWRGNLYQGEGTQPIADRHEILPTGNTFYSILIAFFAWLCYIISVTELLNIPASSLPAGETTCRHRRNAGLRTEGNARTIRWCAT